MNSIHFFVILILTVMYQYYSIKLRLEPNIISNDFIFPKENSLLKNISYSLPTLQMCFGSPRNQCFNLTISSTTSFTTIESINKNPLLMRQFNETESITNNQRRNTIIHFSFMYIDAYRVEGRTMLDVITIPSISNSFIGKDFIFVSLKEKESLSESRKRLPIEGYIGLIRNSFQLAGHHFSLVNYLYITHTIPKENFALSYNNDGSGEVYFGEYFTHQKTCNHNKFYKWNDWDCLLTEIQIGNERRSNLNKTVVFDSAKPFVQIEGKGKVILETVQQLYPNKCNWKQSRDQLFLLCQPDINIESLPHIYFRIGDVELVLEWKYLMKETIVDNEPMIVSLLIAKLYPGTDEVWVLGIPFFMNRIIIFDYETMQVSFVNGYTKLNENDAFALLCFKLLWIILGSGICLCFAIKKNKLMTLK